MRSKIILYFIASLAISTSSWSQKMKLKRANSLRGGTIDGEHFDRVIGNVLFTQRKVAIYCDSAHFFKSKNKINAFGNIRIREGDSVNIVASELWYDGNTRVAQLRKNVVFKKLGVISLHTDFLDYYRKEKRAYYFNGGKLVDGTDTLTSKRGYYDINTNFASFKEDVVGKSAEYTLTSDTIQYDAGNKIIFFRDVSTITNKEGDVMVYENGFHDTKTKVFSLRNGTTRTLSYILKGDQYFLNDLEHVYDIRDNVSITLIKDSLTIYGDRGHYDKAERTAKIYSNAYLSKTDNQGDTLFMSADTLVFIEKKITPKQTNLPKERDSVVVATKDSTATDDLFEKILLAYNNVKIFKTDMQGIADSLAFSTLDSTFYFFHDPVLWTNKSQMTADSIHMVLQNNTIHRIYLIKNPFVASQDSLSNFNQMKGRKMTAYFSKKAISHVDIQGNGESIYFVVDKKNNEPNFTLIGMNHIVCGNMRILFQDEEVSDINFYINPDASFIPPFALKAKDKQLQGFIWREVDKPEKEDVVRTPEKDML